MKKSLCNIFLFLGILHSCMSNATTINASITGDEISWSNASIIDGNIVQNIWESSSKFNVLPVYAWQPGFNKSDQKQITFSSSTGVQVQTSFEHTGVEFRYGAPFVLEPGVTNSQVCSYQSSPQGYYALMGASKCVAENKLSAQQKYKPFEFFRSSISLNNLVEDFKSNNAPAGTYYTSVQVPVSYMMAIGQSLSYQVYSDTLTIIIKYTPSFLDSVSITGDGVFDMNYDTSQHVASGETNFKVNVTGHIEPGLKMTFKSLGDKDAFNLNHKASNDIIPYSLQCDLCKDNIVIEDGKKIDEFSTIPYAGNNLDFNLKFYFNNLAAGEVDEGEYRDAITVLFEIDL